MDECMHGGEEDKLEDSMATRKDEVASVGDVSRRTQKQSSSVRKVVREGWGC
jgi:hypothetical protein